jgi:hypothetical protein
VTEIPRLFDSFHLDETLFMPVNKALYVYFGSACLGEIYAERLAGTARVVWCTHRHSPGAAPPSRSLAIGRVYATNQRADRRTRARVPGGYSDIA